VVIVVDLALLAKRVIDEYGDNKVITDLKETFQRN